MNYYEAEQLTRQRRNQFAREASGDQLVANARNAVPSGQPRRAQTRTIHVGAALQWPAKAVMAGISWLTGRLPGVKDPTLGRRAIGPRHP